MEQTVVFSRSEIELLVSIAASVDPAHYTEEEVKGLIYKCRSLPTDRSVRMILTKF